MLKTINEKITSINVVDLLYIRLDGHRDLEDNLLICGGQKISDWPNHVELAGWVFVKESVELLPDDVEVATYRVDNEMRI